MPVIECRLLGPVEVLIDGGPPPPELMWRKHLGLLIYLRHGPGRGRPRDHLIEVFWRASKPSAARHSLNEALRVLRKVLSPEALASDQTTVRLDPASVALDLEAFDRLTAKSDWTSAANLVQGEFAEGLTISGANEFEDWLSAERLHWRGRSVTALVQAAEKLEASGSSTAAASIAKRALEIDPSSEAALRAALRALSLTGDRGGAKELAARFVERLKAEEGAEPSEDTRDVIQLVLAQAEAEPQGTVAERQPDRTSRQVPLIGRADQLTLLLEAWQESVKQNRSAVLLVQGVAGSGRSRLLTELSSRMELAGASVAATRAVSGDAATPLAGIMALARAGLVSAPGVAAAPPQALAALAGRLPEWHQRFGDLPEKRDLDIVLAVSAVCAAIADEKPLVLVVDDADSVDSQSLAGLEQVLRDNGKLPITVLLAATLGETTDSLDAMVAQIGRSTDGAAARVTAFSEVELFSLASWFVPSYTEDQLARLVRRVYTDSAGLPLLAVELLHAVTLGLDLKSQPSAWPEPLNTLDQTLPAGLPDAVRAAVRIGLGRLPESARLTLATASLFDTRVTADQVASGTSLETGEVLASLDLLERENWLESDPRGYSVRARIVAHIASEDFVTPGQRRRILSAVAGS